MATWVYAFWSTIQSFFTQGFLIIPILLTVILSNNSTLKRAQVTYNHFGLLLLLLCSGIWLLATIAELEILRQIATVWILMAIVLTTCGKKVTTIFLVPLSCLFLLLPIGNGISGWLQDFFCWALMKALTISKQPIYWEGSNIFVNEQGYDLSAYLHALKYTQIYIAFGACYAMVNCKKPRMCMTVTASFIIMPVTILLLSIFLYILLQAWLKSTSMLNNNLSIAGWVLTIIGLIHAMALGYLTRDRRDVITRTDDIDWHNQYFAIQTKFAPRLCIAGIILLLMPFLAQQIKNNPELSQTRVLPNMPSNMTSWHNVSTAKSNTHRAFKKDQQIVNLAIKSIEQNTDHEGNKIKQTNKKIDLAHNKLSVQETILHKAKDKYKVVWSVNYVNGHFTNNKTISKALTNLYNLSPQGAQSGQIEISTDFTDEVNVARERLNDFLQDFTQNYS
jgi:hypothetical protein